MSWLREFKCKSEFSYTAIKLEPFIDELYIGCDDNYIFTMFKNNKTHTKSKRVTRLISSY